MGAFDSIFRKAVHARLDRIAHGRIRILEEGRAYGFGVANGLEATIEVHDVRFFRKVASGGGLGAAEAFLEGWWSCDDLVALLRMVVRNAASVDRFEHGLARVSGPGRRLWRWLRRNTRAGSRRNIHEHYDLGNAFFELWLDPTMTYSCGIYEARDATLEDASIAKLDRICRKLALGREHRVLEIGTGWGSFALHAASQYGCHVTTTTISKEQHHRARARIAAAGLEDRITLLDSDYRDLTGRFDRIVSIEMIEAVGHDHHATFFGKCQDLLATDGEMLLQAITIADARYAQAARSVDFIQRYVFPGSCLLSVTRLCDVATAATDLRLAHLEDLTPHYVRTLADWRRNFRSRVDAVRRLGYPERLIRLWEFYFAYCEAGFAERHIGDVQAVFVRPGCRRPMPLPSLRDARAGVRP